MPVYQAVVVDYVGDGEAGFLEVAEVVEELAGAEGYIFHG
jgi:hypothetical protein